MSFVEELSWGNKLSIAVKAVQKWSNEDKYQINILAETQKELNFYNSSIISFQSKDTFETAREKGSVEGYNMQYFLTKDNYESLRNRIVGKGYE